MHPKGREGAAACPGPLKMHRVPQEAFLRTRISVRYQRRGFPVPNITPVPEKPVLRTECLRKRVAYHRRLFCAPNICSVPEKGASGTESHSRTRKACFLHREPLKMRRVPQEPVFCTARIFRTTGGPLRYRMPQTRRSHILRRRLPRHQHHHYGHPPHGSRLGQETTAKRKNLCKFFKKLRELSRSFFIFVPNKYRNTQCKLFTTNTTNSWNLPR